MSMKVRELLLHQDNECSCGHDHDEHEHHHHHDGECGCATAYEKAKGQYGRVDDAVKIIDPRQE